MTTIIGQISTSDDFLPIQTVSERAATMDEALRQVGDNQSAKIRVAMPASVVSFNPSKQTIVAQPLIREKIINRSNGEILWVQLPQIPDVPVSVPKGGGFIMTMPVAVGDEVLLVFNDMCIDSWWARGGIQNWIDRRRHDLSDAMAILGVSNARNVVDDWSTDSVELRNEDNSIKLKISDDTISIHNGDDTKVEASGSQLLLAFDDTNKIVVDSNGVAITGVLKINGFNYLAHRHADPVSGTTGTVIP